MPFSPTERVQIRKYLGIAEIFKDKDTRAESAMDAIEANAPDAVTMIQGYLTELAQIEAKILQETLECVGTVQVGNIRQDNVRGVMVLRQEGRRRVGFICRALGFRGPMSDVFAAPNAPNPGVFPLSSVPPLGGWPS